MSLPLVHGTAGSAFLISVALQKDIILSVTVDLTHKSRNHTNQSEHIK